MTLKTLKKLGNIIGYIASISFFSIAIYGSIKAHDYTIKVNINTIPYERDVEMPIMVELNPLPDYVASDKSDIYKYNPYLEWTEEEKDILIQISQAEAGNQGTVGMALVMRVVLNRVEKNNSDIKSEVFADHQFATWGMAPGNWENYEALDMVQNGWDESEGALYFCADGWNYYGDEHLFRYKDHWFSK